MSSCPNENGQWKKSSLFVDTNSQPARKWVIAAKRVGVVGGLLAVVGIGYSIMQMRIKKFSQVGVVERPKWSQQPLPSRAAQMKTLKANTEFDVLIIGGGATGAGAALDAASRGLKTAMVEKYDFGSGTSSRSTKLIHGGVRYLQKAIQCLDREQFKLVQEALSERANFMQIAPHLSFPIPIMLPVYEWYQVPYFWLGIKAYDAVAGAKQLKSSYYLGKESALEKFPMLKPNKLKGAIVYYDGSHNDARMNLSIALTAARRGACVANYTEVVELIRKIDPDTGKVIVCGACVIDRQTGEKFDVRAKCVINATGPFTDSIRKLDNQEIEEICQPSSGVHIVLPGYYSPDNMGLLDPSTSDGRVIFFLPWQGRTIAGTTDTPCSVNDHPAPSEQEIQFILTEIKNYLSPELGVRRSDVSSAWSGIRPLVTNPNAKNTQSLSRNHVVETSCTKLITIAGGKWTTYRSMASDVIDEAIKVCKLKPEMKASQTLGLRLEGGHGWTPNHYITLTQTYGLDTSVAKHLSETYGDRAEDVLKLASVTGKRQPIVGKRLAEEFPYIEAEVKYAMQEYACSVADVLALRTRLAFLSCDAAEEALPAVLRIMAKELCWDEDRIEQEKQIALEVIRQDMGSSKTRSRPEIKLDAGEIECYTKKFCAADKDGKGYLTPEDLENLTEAKEEEGESLVELLAAADLNKNGKLELDEFLILMSDMKSGDVKTNQLTAILLNSDAVTTDRSCGGV